jgi:predicted Zn-dependent protease
LTVNSLDNAENTLRALTPSYPDCPEIVLHQARLAQAKGNVTEAADLYYRYTDTDPNDSRGLAYFGRFFLEQRDYMRADALSGRAGIAGADFGHEGAIIRGADYAGKGH